MSVKEVGLRTMNVQDLAGVALDWAVATAKGFAIRLDPMGFGPNTLQGGYWIWSEGHRAKRMLIGHDYSPSTQVVQGAELQYEQRINLSFCHDLRDRNGRYIHASMDTNCHHGYWYGDHHQPLVAVTRCFVRSVFGENIQVPVSLLS